MGLKDPTAAPRSDQQAFGNWPEERLDEIGGRGAVYVQDPLARREAGEARRRRCLELYGAWCPLVRLPRRGPRKRRQARATAPACWRRGQVQLGSGATPRSAASAAGPLPDPLARPAASLPANPAPSTHHRWWT